MSETLEQTITKCLMFAERSTKTYGEKVTNEKIDAWLHLAESKKLTADEFRESFMLMIDGQQDFPAWATFWKSHCKERGSRLRDPVVVGEDDGVLQLGERAACKALGTPYKELSPSEGVKALPPTAEARTEARNRMSEALAKAESKLLGKPKPRKYTEYVEDDSPAEAGKHRERVAAIETEQQQIEEARGEA